MVRSMVDTMNILFLAILVTTFANFDQTLAKFSKSPLQLSKINTLPRGYKSGHLPEAIVNRAGNGRLPNVNVEPVHYDLSWVPILEDGLGEQYKQFTAPGEVTIRVIAKVPKIKTITLNAHKILTIDFESYPITVKPVVVGDKTTFNVTPVHEFDKEFLILKLDKALTMGSEYKIYIKFIAPIATDDLIGIYRSSFMDPENENKISYIATTQFQSTAARQAFPCFDEPSFKATFKISVAFGPGYVALGNNAVETEAEYSAIGVPGWKINQFKKTPKVSSYLIAFTVAKFGYVEATPGNERNDFKKPVRIYAPKHLIDSIENGGRGGGAYAASESLKLLTAFQKYTGIEYHLDKLDSAGIPDFAAGAMENWGLNLYKIPYLLYYPDESTEAERLFVTQILSHELIHQWLGNLVTSDYWDQLWLNEGFADYFEFVGSNLIHTDPTALEYRQFDSFQLGLEADVSSSTHPVVNNVDIFKGSTYDDIDQVFTRITYQKGGAMVRMMEALLTPASFQNGLRTYLKKHEFGAVYQDDLFEVLTARGIIDGKLSLDGPSMKDIMDTWTLQSGFPLVRVSKASDNIIYISQERFKNDYVVYNHEHELNTEHLWTIPVALATADNNTDFKDLTPKLWIHSNTALRSYTHDTKKWIVVNAGSVGFYRVLYDEPLFKNLVNEINKPESAIVSALTRAEILDDYFNFVSYDYSEVENALELTKMLKWETTAVVWDTAFKHLIGYLNKLSSNVDAYNAFKAYLEPKLLEALTAIKNDGEEGRGMILRSKLLDWTCSLGNSECRSFATYLFNKWINHPQLTPIKPDIAPVIICAAIAESTDAYTAALAKYIAPDTSAKTKVYLMNALGCSDDMDKLNELRSYVLEESNSPIQKEHRGTILRNLAANSLSRPNSITFFNNRAPALIQELGTTAIYNYIKELSQFVLTTDQLQTIENTIEANKSDLEDVIKSLEALVASLKVNIEWMSKFCNEGDCRLQKWFEMNKPI